MRVLVYGVLLVILSLLLFGSGVAWGQIMQQQSYVCDLWVNGYRLSWPPKALSNRECFEMLETLKKKDATGAKIECLCEIGGRT